MTSEATSRSISRKNRLAWLLLALVYILRTSTGFVILDSQGKSIWPDSHSYISLANSLVAGEGYRSDLEESLDYRRTPGYPVFLATVFTLFGESYAAVVFIQLILGAGIGLALYFLGSSFVSARVGYLAALLFGLTPNSILWSLSILSDTVFTFLLVVAFLGFTRFFLNQNPRTLALGGIALGFATLVRPIGVVFILIWAALLVVFGLNIKLGARKVLKIGVGFILVVMTVVGPWLVRNAVVWDRWSLSSIATWNLGWYQAPAAVARAKNISLEEARSEIPTSRFPQPGDTRRYLKIILQYPLDYLAAHAQGTWILTTEAGQPNYAQLLDVHYSGTGVLSAMLDGEMELAVELFRNALFDPVDRAIFIGTWYSRGIQLLVYIGALIGISILLSMKMETRWLALLAVFSLGAILLIPGPVGTGRFRVPAEPFLALLAGVGLSILGRSRKQPASSK